ncbi:SIR2 family protein [Marinomonas algicola]|uniref:SIR2 family protein n=1 Tax=Marinomonas algicola TaxID=2773454 RepID=UPI00174EA60A|nr:SIR2 family protein [Marinomonas algicola]
MDLKRLINGSFEHAEEVKEFFKNKDVNDRLDDGDIEGYELLLRKPDGEVQSISPISAVLFSADLPVYRNIVRDDLENRRNQILNTEEFPGNLAAYDRLLNLVKHKATVIPFVGAGFSVASGCPSWSEYIEQEALNAGLKTDIAERLKVGDHENLMDEVVVALGIDLFTRDFRSNFEGGRITPALSPSSELAGLFNECYITTNFDRVLDHCHHESMPFDEKVVGKDDTGRFLKAIYRNEKYLLKLHGNIDEPRDRVLTKNEYDKGYGEGKVDYSFPIPRTLQRIFGSFTVLFVGCSLISDRYLDVLKETYSFAPALIPDHFAIVVAPDDEAERLLRDRHLASHGITPIWFANGDWDKPEEILKLLKLES